MLTKDLLKYTIRGDRVFPKYLKPSDSAFRDLAFELETRFQQCVGARYRDLSDELRQHPQSSQAVFQGFCKLLEERCEFAEAHEQLEEQRSEWLIIAQSLRQQEFADYRNFQSAVARACGLTFAELEEKLYGDLAEFRLVLSFAPWGAEALVNRYNIAQIQGLLLRAQKVTVTINSRDVLQRRRLLQKLRFCRLYAELPEENSKDELRLELSGPLAIFEQAQSYGMRLCQFFPYVLLFENWKLEAELRLGERTLLLELDGKKTLTSHYRGFSGHIPPEFQALIDSFNGLSESERRAWKAGEGTESFNLGKQNYCFPDVSFTHPSGQACHFELFHRWHQGELQRRLASLESGVASNFYFGVSKDLLKDKELEEKIALLQKRDVNIFTFRQFPTLKAVLTYLAQVKVDSGVV